MHDIERGDVGSRRCDRAERLIAVQDLRRRVFEALLGAISRDQDAPRACSTNNGLLAMTRLAKPNRGAVD